MRSADEPTTRELAQRLITYEGSQIDPADGNIYAVGRVCDKLRGPLATLVGPAGFCSLLMRALTLAKRDAPVLSAWEVRPDGSLEGLSDETTQMGAVLIAQLIGLMITFIGESLTLRLLRDVWVDLPDSAAMVERNESE